MYHTRESRMEDEGAKCIERNANENSHKISINHLSKKPKTQEKDLTPRENWIVSAIQVSCKTIENLYNWYKKNATCQSITKYWEVYIQILKKIKYAKYKFQNELIKKVGEKVKINN